MSRTSIGFGDDEETPTAPIRSPSSAMIPTTKTIDNIVVFILHCSKHKRIGFTQKHHQLVWFPYIYFRSNFSWEEAFYSGTQILDLTLYKRLLEKQNDDEFKIMKIKRIQWGHSSPFITSVFAYIQVDAIKEYECCQNSQKFEWKDLEAAKKLKPDQILDKEVKNLIELVATNNFSKLPKFEEISFQSMVKFLPRENPINSEEHLLLDSGVSLNDIQNLFRDYLEHCFPASIMNNVLFKKFMRKYKLISDEDQLNHYYKLFSFKSKDGFLSFDEMLLGLTFITSKTLNNEKRVKFIFDYYDEDRDGFLNMQELECFLMDVKEREESKLQDANSLMKKYGIKSKSGQMAIKYDRFVKEVGAKNIRGTSVVCRVNVDIFDIISKERKIKTSGRMKTYTLERILYKSSCGQCVPRPQCLSLMIPRILKNKVISANYMDGTKFTDIFCENILVSKPLFDQKSCGHILMKKIEEFNNNKGTYQSPNGLMTEEKEMLFSTLSVICSQVDKILLMEPRLIKIVSPAFIFGGIHGNVADLISFSGLWPTFPLMASKNVFLGNFMGRGKWSLETIFYLLAMKSLLPQQIILLRGKNELQGSEDFKNCKNDCISKYGEDFGKRIWNLLNSIFEKLPFVAIIDESIYCAHGGIPKRVNLQLINEIPVPLKNHKNSIALEILCNEPIDNQQFIEFVSSHNNDSIRGFFPRRESGKGFHFSQDATQYFLESTGLTRICRSNEFLASGIKCQHNDHCISIFSCSKYNGSNNKASVIFVDKNRLRILFLDTQNNAPAMGNF